MKILIVDDSTHVLKQLPKALERFFPEAEIDTAWSYVEADKLLKENIYEVILLDGELSEHITDPWQHAFGYYLIEPIRNSSSSKATIIMISTDEQMRNQGEELGANFKISKNEFFGGGKVINSLTRNFTVEDGL